MSAPGNRREIEHAVGWLARGSVRIGLRFSAETLALQAAWPETSPLSEDEVRAQLRAALEEIRGVGKRLKAMADRLPEPPELQQVPDDDPQDSFDEVPSVYLQLTGAVDYIVGEAVPDIESVVSGALDATPESLRAAWIRGQLPGNLGRLLHPAATEPESS